MTAHVKPTAAVQIACTSEATGHLHTQCSACPCPSTFLIMSGISRDACASRYKHSQLIEVNAHSLFSKYFSESGKLVSRLFAKIQEQVEDKDTLVFVLIDEVESLTAARQSAVSGNEPADAIRCFLENG